MCLATTYCITSHCVMHSGGSHRQRSRPRIWWSLQPQLAHASSTRQLDSRIHCRALSASVAPSGCGKPTKCLLLYVTVNASTPGATACSHTGSHLFASTTREEISLQFSSFHTELCQLSTSLLLMPVACDTQVSC